MTPDNAAKVLRHDRYWTVPFLRLYLEKCDDVAFWRPEHGHRLGLVAPELVDKIGVGARPGEYRDLDERRSCRVLALAVQATTLRAGGLVEPAADVLRRAYGEASGRRISRHASAQLLARSAMQHAFGGDPRAEPLLDRARQCLPHRDGHDADLLAARGLARLLLGRDGGGVDLAQALEARIHDRAARAKRTVVSCLHNLLTGTADGGPVSRLEQDALVRVLARVRAALSKEKRSVAKMTVFWLEGRVLHNLQVHRHAARRLDKARAGFAHLGAWDEHDLVCLELAALALAEGHAAAARAALDRTRLAGATDLVGPDALVRLRRRLTAGRPAYRSPC